MPVSFLEIIPKEVKKKLQGSFLKKLYSMSCIQDYSLEVFLDEEMEKKGGGLGYSKVHQNLECPCNPHFYIKYICMENNEITLSTSHLHANLYFIFTIF